MTKKQIEKRRYATEMEIKTIIQHIQLRMGLNRFLAQAQPQFQLNLEVGIFYVFCHTKQPKFCPKVQKFC